MSSSGLVYRTPSDVRSIPSTQWEAWLRGDCVPFQTFSSSRDCQSVLRHVVRATKRRMDAQR